MYSSLLIPVLGAALVHGQTQVQGPAAPASTLDATQSGVLPVLPTPFSGVETEEGAITYDGPANPGFTGLLGDAVAQSGQTSSSVQAVLPKENFDPFTGSTITGSVIASTVAGGTGVNFAINFTGFPSEAAYGPFVYHIHGLPVPADGNCTTTLGHLDPTDRGEYYPCDSTNPQTCQAGDLAGKHGNITGTSFQASYNDPYLSLIPGSPYYFGDLSIVIHSMNTTRLTCANFLPVSASTNGTAPNATAPASPTSTIVPFTGAAARVSVGAVAILGGLAAFFL